MTRRTVHIYNATAATDISARGANLNEVRVEVRVIYPDQAQAEELADVMERAFEQARQGELL